MMAGSSVLMIDSGGTAVAPVTLVLTVAEVLLSSLLSAIVLSGSTDAVFVSGPVAGAVTCKVIVAF